MIQQVSDNSSSWIALIFMAVGCFYAGYMFRDSLGWNKLEALVDELEELKNRYLEKLRDKK